MSKSIVFRAVEVMRAKHQLHFEFDVSENTHAQFIPRHSSPQVAHIVHLLVS